jgi:hypothetical protein
MQQLNNFCNYTQPVYGSDSLLNPVFTVAPLTKMLLSAWVREESATPLTNYINNKIALDFPGSSSAQLELKPTGNVIDGWQRYEAPFTVPAGSTSMSMSFVNNSSSNIYYDDIRIHPFNSQMKSYVYDPVNLRLVAELDPNNYARYYEYDEEGSLIRTKAETVEGIKTINESRSAKQRIITNPQ